MRVGGASDVGRVRKVNEDAFWFDQRLLIVADGMGGHVAGEVASRVALETVKERVAPLSFDGEAPLERVVQEALQEANRQVYRRAYNDGLHGMGTTLTMALVVDGHAVVGHVGDSRAYQLRDGRLIQVTEDHSMVTELVKSGDLSESEAVLHPYRHYLTRALGTAEEVQVDVHRLTLGPGEALLLCTDGLTAVVTEQEIVDTIQAFDDPQSCAVRLVEMANERGGPDNVTVVLAVMEAS